MELLANLGPGTLFAGNAGLLQLTLLPGLLMQRALARDRLIMPATDTLLFIFVSSGVTSFLLLLLLQQTGLHNRSVWMLLGWVQVLALLLLSWRSVPAEHRLTEAQALPLVSLLSMLVYLFCLVELVLTVVGHWPGVLEGWDAVVSWNRWARDWTNGDWPFLTWGYPQLVPALWSLLYVWQDSSEIEFFVRIWMGLFPVLLALVFLSLFVHWRRWSLLVAGAAMSGLLLGPYSNVLDSGYVDVPVTFATLLTGHWVMLASKDSERRARWLLQAAFAAAFALLTKQSGMLAFGLLLWGCCRCGLRSRDGWLPLVLVVVMTVPWYTLAWLHESSDSVIAYVTGDIYGNETLSDRVARALTQTLPAVLGLGTHAVRNSVMAMLGISGLLLALRDRHGRFCAFVGLGYVLVWAAFFSYDGRNLLPGIPFVLLAIANGYGWMPLSPPWMYESLKAVEWQGSRLLLPRLLPALSLLILLAALLPANTRLWEQRNDALRQRTGDPDFNSRLTATLGAASGEIYTTYAPLVAIAGLRDHWFNDYGASHMQPRTAAALLAGSPLCETLATIPQHEAIQYLLLHNWIFPAVIEPALANGSLQTLMTGTDVRLMQVHCKAAAAP